MTATTQSVSHHLPPARSEHGVLPLAPIEKPRGLFLRLLYRMTRKRYGATPTAFKVIYARAPGLALSTMFIALVLERFLTLDKSLRFLLQVGNSMEAGCTFCADLSLAEAVRARMGKERFAALADSETSDLFDERERAALAYARAVHCDRHVDDAVFARLRRSFDEREIVEIIWLCAVERYFHSMALPLRIGSDRLAERSTD